MSRWLRMRPVAVSALVVVALVIAKVWADPCNSGSTHFRSGVVPVPLGTFVNDWHNAQAAAADADRFVIYRHEWFQGGKTLGPYGRYHLHQLVQRLSSTPFPIVIQPDLHDDKLNQARQKAIVKVLLASGIADAEARVVLGFAQAEGLYGEAAPRIFMQQIQGTRGGAGGFGGTGGLGTGFSLGGGMGFSGGGFRGY